MKNLLFFLSSFFILLACNSKQTKESADDSAIVSPNVDTAFNSTQRKKIITALQQLQSVIASNDKSKIAAIFQLPISNNRFGIYIDDSSFNEQLIENKDNITSDMFTRHFSAISESIQLKEMNELFKQLPLDSLALKNELTYNSIVSTKPCYQYYTIEIDQQLVRLTLGTNSNKNYQPTSKDATPENDSSICEHMLWWLFEFNGDTLQFKEIGGAG